MNYNKKIKYRKIMKDIKEYILESKAPNWKKIAKSLSNEDKEWIKSLANDTEHNQIWTMEEIENHCWKGDLKDSWNDEYLKLIDHILTRENGITQKDVIDCYSLARSGKQSMIEVFAQTIYMINREL